MSKERAKQADLTYRRMVFHAALVASRDAVGIGSSLATGVIAFLFAYLVLGPDKAMEDYLKPLLFGIAASAIWFVFFFAYQAVRSAQQIHRDQAKEIAALEKQRDERKLLQISTREDPATEDGICRATIHNDGPHDQFSVVVDYALPGGNEHLPVALRWKGVSGDRVHIGSGHHAVIELIQVLTERDRSQPQWEQQRIVGLNLLTVSGDRDLCAQWFQRGRVLKTFMLYGRVTGLLTGKSMKFQLIVNAATDGHNDTQVSCVFIDRTPK